MFFVLLRRTGPEWDPALPLEGQSGWEEHAAFMDGLVADGCVTCPLHGRRYDQWFEPEKSSDRYDYLYTAEELKGWKDKIESVAKKADVTFVVANNHFEGKAPANALELRSMISGRKVKAPETLVKTYPRLEAIAEVAAEPKTMLF